MASSLDGKQPTKFKPKNGEFWEVYGRDGKTGTLT
jgi:hypothetical protein